MCPPPRRSSSSSCGDSCCGSAAAADDGGGFVVASSSSASFFVILPSAGWFNKTSSSCHRMHMRSPPPPPPQSIDHGFAAEVAHAAPGGFFTGERGSSESPDLLRACGGAGRGGARGGGRREGGKKQEQGRKGKVRAGQALGSTQIHKLLLRCCSERQAGGSNALSSELADLLHHLQGALGVKRKRRPRRCLGAPGEAR